jgi:hypothetical protein
VGHNWPGFYLRSDPIRVSYSGQSLARKSSGGRPQQSRDNALASVRCRTSAHDDLPALGLGFTPRYEIAYRVVKPARVSAAFGRFGLRRRWAMFGGTGVGQRTRPEARPRAVPSNGFPHHHARPGRPASGRSALRTPQPLIIILYASGGFLACPVRRLSIGDAACHLRPQGTRLTSTVVTVGDVQSRPSG